MIKYAAKSRGLSLSFHANSTSIFIVALNNTARVEKTFHLLNYFRSLFFRNTTQLRLYQDEMDSITTIATSEGFYKVGILKQFISNTPLVKNNSNTTMLIFLKLILFWDFEPIILLLFRSYLKHIYWKQACECLANRRKTLERKLNPKQGKKKPNNNEINKNNPKNPLKNKKTQNK